MKAVVLEKKNELSIREIDIREELGPNDVRINIGVVGICGSDIHYYNHGKIGPYVVDSPMVLGHEGAGTIAEVGSNVKDLKEGDRICMEPGIPDMTSKESLSGMYNLDPSVKFWATPPYHGILRPSVVHPASFTYKLPENVSISEGALVEPLAIGMQGAKKARIEPGDIAVVIGVGTIGMVTIMAALASGCSRVIAIDILRPKLDIAAKFGAVKTICADSEDVTSIVMAETEGYGADIVFEASGNEKAASGIFGFLRPGGKVVYIGMPPSGVTPINIIEAQSKEARIETVFRYANVFKRALQLMGSGSIDVKPLITDSYSFEDSIKAFEYAANPKPESVKVQIHM